MYLHYLLEEFIGYTENPVGDKFPLFKNPEKKDFEVMDKNNGRTYKGFFRGIADLEKKEIFFAPSNVYHNEMADKLNLPRNYTNNGINFFTTKLYFEMSKDGRISSMDSVSEYLSKGSKSNLEKKLTLINELIENVEKNKSFLSKWINYESLIELLNRNKKQVEKYIK